MCVFTSAQVGEVSVFGYHSSVSAAIRVSQQRQNRALVKPSQAPWTKFVTAVDGAFKRFFPASKPDEATNNGRT